jgi:hypothetical protein
MKVPFTHTTPAAFGLAIAALLASPIPAVAHDAACTNADQILRQVSAKLAGASQFTFKAHRQADAALAGGEVPQDARLEVTVARPNRIATKVVGGKGGRDLYADGKNLSLHDPKMKLYATVPMRTSIDGLVDRIDAKYGFTPPIAEFVLSDPYSKGFKQVAKSVTYIGRDTRSAGFFGKKTECHHLALKGKAADAELWIGVADQLPRTLIATFKDRPGQPKLRIDFSDWNLAANVNASAFTFVPGKDAVKVPMRTTAEVAATAKKAARK